MAKKSDEKTDLSDLSLEAALKSISKHVGVTLSKVKDQEFESVKRLTTGSIDLDMATGGGWAFGRIHEVYGPESTGKTLLSLFAIVEAQKLGVNCAFVDMEHSLSPDWAAQIGVDLDNLIFTQPDSGEQALNSVIGLCETGKVGLIVIDSVAALVPQSELDGEIGDQSMGVQARMIGQALRKISPAAAKNNVIVIFINQLRMKIGLVFGNPETTPGGAALKFYSTIRMEVRRVSKSEITDEHDNASGHDQRVKIVKNKIAPPFREAIVPISYFTGLRPIDDVVYTAIKLNYPDSTGAKLTGTKSDMYKALKDPAVFAEVTAEVRKLAGLK